jgi:hypothetical protein
VVGASTLHFVTRVFRDKKDTYNVGDVECNSSYPISTLYYGALLKKLTLEIYKEANNHLNSFLDTDIGSIYDVLQNMDQNLFTILHNIFLK